MGRPRKSKEELALAGSDKAHPGRYADRISTPDAVLISKLSCPTKYRPETKRAWEQIVPTLIGIKVLSEQDIAEINAMFRLFNTFIIADERLEQVILHEYEYDDEFQYLTAFERWNNQRLKTWTACQNLMSKFGIGPSERAKLTLPEKKEESPIEQLLKKAAQ